MNALRSTSRSARPTAPARPEGPRPDAPGALRPLLAFTAVALPVGGALLAVSTLVEPGEPFILAAVLLALVLPALVLTHREAGWVGVRALLRDAVRLPRSPWWLLVAAFALPALSWGSAAAIGGARSLNGSLLATYVLDLVVGAVVINIWEELAWAGFVQRRAATRWGDVRGALATAVLFTGIHVPLAFDDVSGAGDVVRGVVFIAAVATAVRLLIARIDPWSGRSLLTVGVLHSSFNASELVLDPAYDWVRIVVAVVAGLAAVSVPTRRRIPPRAPQRAPTAADDA